MKLRGWLALAVVIFALIITLIKVYLPIVPKDNTVDVNLPSTLLDLEFFSRAELEGGEREYKWLLDEYLVNRLTSLGFSLEALSSTNLTSLLFIDSLHKSDNNGTLLIRTSRENPYGMSLVLEVVRILRNSIKGWEGRVLIEFTNGFANNQIEDKNIIDAPLLTLDINVNYSYGPIAILSSDRFNRNPSSLLFSNQPLKQYFSKENLSSLSLILFNLYNPFSNPNINSALSQHQNNLLKAHIIHLANIINPIVAGAPYHKSASTIENARVKFFSLPFIDNYTHRSLHYILIDVALLLVFIILSIAFYKQRYLSAKLTFFIFCLNQLLISIFIALHYLAIKYVDIFRSNLHLNIFVLILLMVVYILLLIKVVKFYNIPIYNIISAVILSLLSLSIICCFFNGEPSLLFLPLLIVTLVYLLLLFDYTKVIIMFAFVLLLSYFIYFSLFIFSIATLSNFYTLTAVTLVNISILFPLFLLSFAKK